MIDEADPTGFLLGGAYLERGIFPSCSIFVKARELCLEYIFNQDGKFFHQMTQRLVEIFKNSKLDKRALANLSNEYAKICLLMKGQNSKHKVEIETGVSNLFVMNFPNLILPNLKHLTRIFEDAADDKLRMIFVVTVFEAIANRNWNW